MIMSRDKFIKCMKQFQDIHIANDALYERTKDIFNLDWLCDNTCRYENFAISRMSDSSNISEDWLSWFIFDNDFGKKKLKAKYDSDSKFTAIKNAGDLWNFCVGTNTGILDPYECE